MYGYMSVTECNLFICLRRFKQSTPIFGKDDYLKRNLIKKLSAVFVTTAVLFTTVFSVSIFAHAATPFTPRLSAPDWSNRYYYDGNYNVFQQYGYGLPNCTAYAYGRAYEILGTEPNLSWNGAGLWYDYNRSNGYYPYGRTPKVGAIACWNYGSGGHVAVVEKIDSDGSMTLSNSEWGGRTFYLTYANASDSNPGGNSWWTFQGYIYIIDSAEPSYDPPETTEDVTPTDYQPGTYKVDASPYLNMRSGSGMGYGVVGTVPDRATITVTDTYYADGMTWGKTTYNGKTGWVSLAFCDFVAPVQETTAAPETTVPETTVPETTLPEVTLATDPVEDENPTQRATVYIPTGDVTPDKDQKDKKDKDDDKKPLIGDVNHDGKISILDATIIQKYLAGIADLSGDDIKLCDFNQDGRVTIDDVTSLQRFLINK